MLTATVHASAAHVSPMSTVHGTTSIDLGGPSMAPASTDPSSDLAASTSAHVQSTSRSSLRSQSKLREILSDHNRRGELHRSTSLLEQRNVTTGKNAAAESRPSTLTSRLAAESDNTKGRQINEGRDPTGLDSSALQGKSMGNAGTDALEDVTNLQSHLDTPTKGRASQRLNQAPDALTSSGSLTPKKKPQSSSLRREAPPLYASKSSPLLDRSALAVDATSYTDFPHSSSMQRQRSLREALERQHQHAQAPALQKAESSLSVSPAANTALTSVGPLATMAAGSAAAVDQGALDSIHGSAMHRQRSGGASLDAKVVILGTQGVGKTSLVHRYTSGIFSASSMPSTIGASFLTKKLLIDGIKVRLQLWDTAGQERFRSMAPMYYRGSNAAVIVYDITNPSSFDDVKSWIDELRENVHSDLIIHVVGSKADLAPSQRRVDLDAAREAVAMWTIDAGESSPGSASLSRATPPSILGSRRGTSTSPPAGMEPTSPPSHARSSLPASSASTGRLLNLGALVGMGGKSPPSRGEAHDANADSAERSSDPSTAASTTPEGIAGAQGAEAALTPDSWDYIDVTEVSAKDNDGIEDVFSGIATRLVERREQLEAEAEERKRRQRKSIFLSEQDLQDKDGRDVGTSQYSWCCST